MPPAWPLTRGEKQALLCLLALVVPYILYAVWTKP